MKTLDPIYLKFKLYISILYKMILQQMLYTQFQRFIQNKQLRITQASLITRNNNNKQISKRRIEKMKNKNN